MPLKTHPPQKKKNKKTHLWKCFLCLKETTSCGTAFYVEFKILIKMLNPHVPMKVGRINLQLVDLIIRMFLFMFYNHFIVVSKGDVFFLKQNKKLLYLPKKTEISYTPSSRLLF